VVTGDAGCGAGVVVALLGAGAALAAVAGAGVCGAGAGVGPIGGALDEGAQPARQIQIARLRTVISLLRGRGVVNLAAKTHRHAGRSISMMPRFIAVNPGFVMLERHGYRVVNMAV
jgi:hypothetical protein